MGRLMDGGPLKVIPTVFAVRSSSAHEGNVINFLRDFNVFLTKKLCSLNWTIGKN